MNFYETIASNFETVRNFSNFNVLYPFSPKSLWRVNKHGLLFLDQMIIGTYWWWSNGYQKQGESVYRNAILNGPRVTWWENGKIQSKVFYHNGKLNGLSTHWDAKGNRIAEINYKNIAFLQKCLTERGKLFSRRLTSANATQQRQMERKSLKGYTKTV